MSVRSVIILLALPLFLLLAGVNGLLLYDEETKDMQAGLRGEALSAAVTVAEFARQARDPFAELAEPGRLAALRDATAKIPGLAALYLTRQDGRLLVLSGAAPGRRDHLPVPARAMVVSDGTSADGDPLITALAPAGRGTMVVADIDAGPLARRTFHLKRLALGLIGGSAALAVLLGLIVARRVTREFDHIRAITAQRATTANGTPLGIREVRDLADAIGLLDKSVADELERIARRSGGGLAEGIAAVRARHFPDLTLSQGGIELAIRVLPDAPAGSVPVAVAGEDGWKLALGEAEGPPAEAVAAAIAARELILAGSPEAFTERLDLAARSFGIVWRVQAEGLTGGVFVLAGDTAAIAAYAARNPGLAPTELVGDLAILFPGSGIVAALRTEA